MIHVTKCDITYNKGNKCDIYNKNNIFCEHRYIIENIDYEIALTLRMKQIHFMI